MVRCNNCMTELDEDDLELVAEITSKTSDPEDAKTEWIKACPKCKTDAYLMDIN